MRLFYRLLLAAGLLAHLPGQAQQLDPAFVPSINLTTGSATKAAVVQPDGKVLISIVANRYDGQLGGQLMRLNADGSPDVAFRTRAGAGPRTGTYSLNAIALQPDGKILVAGGVLNDYDGVPRAQPMRLNADGSLDTSFDATAAGLAGLNIIDLAVQPDGKVLVGSSAGQVVTRLLPDGRPDPSFTLINGFQNPGSRIVEMGGMLLQADGKIVVAGHFTHRSSTGVVHESVVRFNADGTLDTSFTSPLSPSNLVLALAQQPDGKLLVGGGDLLTTAGSSPFPHVLRLLPDGSLDPTFQQIRDYGSTIGDLRVQANGDILAAGFFSSYGGQAAQSIVRLRSTGAPDATFATAQGPTGYVSVLLPLPSGQYLVGGFYDFFGSQSRPGLARISATGQLDASFAPVLNSAAATSLAVPLRNGKLHLRLGTEYNGRAVNPYNYQRLAADGSYEAPVPLSQPATADQGIPNAVPQPDGTFYHCYRLGNVAVVQRLLPSGQPDPSFTVDTLHYDNSQGIYSVGETGMLVLPSGKVAIWGGFSQVNNLPRPGVALLLPNGQPDPGFAPAPTVPWAGIPVYPYLPQGIAKVLAQPSGQVAVLWHDTTRTHLTRLLPDGSVDASFTLGTAAGSTGIFSALGLANGQLLLSGDFMSFSGQATPNGLVRLLPDGRPDPAFTAASAAASLLRLPHGQLEQPDGRLLIMAPGSSSKELLLRRLEASGAIDNSFQPISVSSETVEAVAPNLSLQPADQAIVLSGFFTHVAGQPRFGLARLVNTLLATRSLASTPALDVFPNPARAQVQVQLPALATGPATLLDVQGRTVRTWPAPASKTTLALTGLAPGVYLLMVPTAQGPARQRVVVE
jgi:uncharacterized delta-60 repeat protein